MLFVAGLGARSAWAFAPESCSVDPVKTNQCDPFDANKACYRSGDALGSPTGVCAATFGCSCIDPKPVEPNCAISHLGSSGSNVGIAFAGLSVGLVAVWRRRRFLRRRQG